ncbi:hypothetical protein AB0J63_42050 [Streptosporangium canum]|uniref:hypothetical protein n=1 Tax=Streptosporangium canum TaxID=324952 RepID=UPI00341217D1
MRAAPAHRATARTAQNGAAAQRDHLAALLGEDDAWTFSVPPGGLALWLRLAGVRGDDLAAAAAECGLAFFPGSRFSADGTLSGWLRMPYTAPPEALDRAAAQLRRAHHTCRR